MRKELIKPVLNAIFALFLLGLIKIVAMFMLKEVNGLLTYISIALSLGVVIVLLKFMMEFNHQLEKTSPDQFQVRSLVKWIVILMVILTLYGTFGMFSGIPYGLYYVIFFILTLVPVYSLWKILYNNSDLLPDILRNVFSEEIIKCSCGWKNPVYAKFCQKCGSVLKNGDN
ncbi:MAG: hypothetical protein WA144_06770 [Candidatus Methanoperedens sp.]